MVILLLVCPLANFRRRLSGLLIPRCWSLVQLLLSHWKVCSTSVFCFVLCRVSSGEENRVEYWQLCHLMGFIMSRSKLICREINNVQDIHTIHVHCTHHTIKCKYRVCWKNVKQFSSLHQIPPGWGDVETSSFWLPSVNVDLSRVCSGGQGATLHISHRTGQ